MLAYLPNPIWRPSAILEKSCFFFLTPIFLMILVHGTLFYVIFIIGVNFHANLRSKSNMADVGHVGKVIFFVPCTIFTCNTSTVTNCGRQNFFLMFLLSVWCLFI